MRMLYMKPELDDLSQGSRIAFARQFRFMTQDSVSDKLGLTGVCKRRTMTRYEKGDRNPKEERTLEIAKILNVSYEAIKKYSENLYNKKELIVANKMDLDGSKENLAKFKKEYPDAEVIEISAVKNEGTKELIFKLKELLQSIPDEDPFEKNEYEEYVLYEFKHEKPYQIKRNGNKWVVTGEKLEKLLKMTRFNSDESALRFASKLKNLGVDDELKSLGAKTGDIVCILDKEFEYEERLY